MSSLVNIIYKLRYNIISGMLAAFSALVGKIGLTIFKSNLDYNKSNYLNIVYCF